MACTESSKACGEGCQSQELGNFNARRSSPFLIHCCPLCHSDLPCSFEMEIQNDGHAVLSSVRIQAVVSGETNATVICRETVVPLTVFCNRIEERALLNKA